MRVVLAEDNALLRDGVALVLTENGFVVVASVADAVDLMTAVVEHRPDLVIADVRMPPTYTDEGVRAALRIRTEFPDIAVLVLSQWVEMTYARQLLFDQSGMVGYLLKDRIVNTADFIDAARRVADGGTALDQEVVRQLLAQPSTDKGLARLTDREGQVLARLAEGKSNQAIADEFFLATRSVEKNISSIFQKLDLSPAPTDHRRVLAVLRYLHSAEARAASSAAKSSSDHEGPLGG